MVSKKRILSLLAALILCLSSVTVPISAIEEQPSDSINATATGWTCSEWVETDPQQKPINCTHQTCGNSDGTAYQMIMYIRACVYPDGDTMSQVKREDVFVGCCDYPYA